MRAHLCCCGPGAPHPPRRGEPRVPPTPATTLPRGMPAPDPQISHELYARHTRPNTLLSSCPKREEVAGRGGGQGSGSHLDPGVRDGGDTGLGYLRRLRSAGRGFCGGAAPNSGPKVRGKSPERGGQGCVGGGTEETGWAAGREGQRRSRVVAPRARSGPGAARAAAQVTRGALLRVAAAPQRKGGSLGSGTSPPRPGPAAQAGPRGTSASRGPPQSATPLRPRARGSRT